MGLLDDFSHPLDTATAWITGGRTPSEVSDVASRQNEITMRQLREGKLTPLAAETYTTLENQPVDDSGVSDAFATEFRSGWNDSLNSTVDYFSNAASTTASTLGNLGQGAYDIFANLPWATGSVLNDYGTGIGNAFKKATDPVVSPVRNTAIIFVAAAAIYLMFLSGPAIRETSGAVAGGIRRVRRHYSRRLK